MSNSITELSGESLVAKKLDEMGIKYRWNHVGKNNMGADFLTDDGDAISVKISNRQSSKRVSLKTNMVSEKFFWSFNKMRENKHNIAFFVFMIVGYKYSKPLYFILPNEICKGVCFRISERQIETGKYGYYLNNWELLKNKG